VKLLEGETIGYSLKLLECEKLVKELFEKHNLTDYKFEWKKRLFLSQG
jgi:hypothetical protein